MIKTIRRGSFDNSDLRLLNVKKEDLVFYKHKIFIVTWQRAKNVAEVAKKLKISVEWARNLATKIRHLGVPLKPFRLFNQDKEKLLAFFKTLPPPTTEALDYTEFMAVWQKATSIDEVCRKLKISKRTAMHRAAKLRGYHGIPLQKFTRHGKMD